MTSHEYARKLADVADLLAAAPVFDMPVYVSNVDHRIHFFHDKIRFINAVRAIGSGTKRHNDISGYYEFSSAAAGLTLLADRNAVCKIVKPAQPAEYECEPLLSQSEVEQIGS